MQMIKNIHYYIRPCVKYTTYLHEQASQTPLIKDSRKAAWNTKGNKDGQITSFYSTQATVLHIAALIKLVDYLSQCMTVYTHLISI